MKTILLDMYGVILKESKGNFIPYTSAHFPQSEHVRIIQLFREEQLFTRAGNGEMDSDTFLRRIGFADPAFHMRDYLENHLTLDEGFLPFVQAMRTRYRFALLSNDVAQWSAYITQFYRLDAYFYAKTVSGDVHCRKPQREIYEIALRQMGVPAQECIFVDNSTENLRAARALGFETVLFNRDGEEYDGKTVYSFCELEQLL